MPKTRTKKKNPLEEIAESSPHLSKPDPFGFAAVASKSGVRQAKEVLDRVTAVPTIFPDFDRATRVGGLPVRRIHTIHGPTHGGKTAFVVGLVKSFVMRGFAGCYIDAEHATDLDFVESIMKEDIHSPTFVAERPDSYESTIAKVDDFLKMVREVRKKHPEFCSIMVVDSINKLTPERELKTVLKGGTVDGKKGAKEMTKGHQGRYRAQVNQAWLDHLTPKLAAANCACVLIAQERSEGDDPWDYAIKGGAAIQYDSSLIVRVMKASPVFRDQNDKKNEGILGFRHKIRIHKSKVGHMDGRYTDGHFHISNGKMTPPGLDKARDLFMVGVGTDVIEQKGSWYKYGRKKVQGEHKMVLHLAENLDLQAKVEASVRDVLAANRMAGG